MVAALPLEVQQKIFDGCGNLSLGAAWQSQGVMEFKSDLTDGGLSYSKALARGTTRDDIKGIAQDILSDRSR